jgi:hypothetical protein
LLLDSSVKSMPLLVFEISRAFQIENLSHVMSCEHFGDLSHEMTFRVLALMVFNLVHFNNDGMIQGPEIEDFKFRVLDDSIFD